MTNCVVNLNKLASELCGEATKVRVRIVEQTVIIGGVETTMQFLQIRPTDRKIGKGLPKGEVLFDLKTRADRGTKRFAISEDFRLPYATGMKLSATAVKHGWIQLAIAADAAVPVGQVAPAGASVTEK